MVGGGSNCSIMNYIVSSDSSIMEIKYLMLASTSGLEEPAKRSSISYCYCLKHWLTFLKQTGESVIRMTK